MFPFTPANYFELVSVTLIDLLALFPLDLPGYFILPARRTELPPYKQNKKKTFKKIGSASQWAISVDLGVLTVGLLCSVKFIFDTSFYHYCLFYFSDGFQGLSGDG